MRRYLMSSLILIGLAVLLATPFANAAEARQIVVAGGCFWCVESDFDKAAGVVETVSGYTGGETDAPSYKSVTYGETGHYEAVRITYDPDQTDLRSLLDIFWRTVDPTDPAGQFCDRGASYRTAVFVANDEERRIAEGSKQAAQDALGQRIVTPILDAKTFWPAEDEHQDYYEKNPYRYKIYRWGCGRDSRVGELWGDAARQGLGR